MDPAVHLRPTLARLEPYGRCALPTMSNNNDTYCEESQGRRGVAATNGLPAPGPVCLLLCGRGVVPSASSGNNGRRIMAERTLSAEPADSERMELAREIHRPRGTSLPAGAWRKGSSTAVVLTFAGVCSAFEPAAQNAAAPRSPERETYTNWCRVPRTPPRAPRTGRRSARFRCVPGTALLPLAFPPARPPFFSAAIAGALPPPAWCVSNDLRSTSCR